VADRAQSLSFDRVAEEYDVTRGGEERATTMATAVLPVLPAGRILEAGVGTGIVAQQLQRRGTDILGIDIAPAMLGRARERLGPRVAVGDVHRLPVRSETVDGVLVVWMLHLVADVEVAVAELARVLRPGGRLVVVPSRPLRPDVDVELIQERLWSRLQPNGRTDDVDRLVPLAERLGLHAVASSEFATKEYEISPAALAEVTRRRSFSILFDVDDETWRRDVDPLIEELRALPDQQRGRRVLHRYCLLAWEK